MVLDGFHLTESIEVNPSDYQHRQQGKMGQLKTLPVRAAENGPGEGGLLPEPLGLFDVLGGAIPGWFIGFLNLCQHKLSQFI